MVLMTEQFEIRVHGEAGLPTLVYLPGLHGDWTLVGSFRHAVSGRVRFVEMTYPRTLAWSLDDYGREIEAALARLPELVVKYPYFQKNTDTDDWIGGYASPGKPAPNYSWMYTLGEIVTSLAAAGLYIEWLHEYDWLFYKLSSEKHVRDAQGNWVFPEHREKVPYTFSLKATVR